MRTSKQLNQCVNRAHSTSFHKILQSVLSKQVHMEIRELIEDSSMKYQWHQQPFVSSSNRQLVNTRLQQPVSNCKTIRTILGGILMSVSALNNAAAANQAAKHQAYRKITKLSFLQINELIGEKKLCNILHGQTCSQKHAIKRDNMLVHTCIHIHLYCRLYNVHGISMLSLSPTSVLNKLAQSSQGLNMSFSEVYNIVGQ